MATDSGVENHSVNDRLSAFVLDVLRTIRSSFTNFMVAVGVVWIITGYAVQEGVIAGMLILWGISVIVFALLVRVGLRLIGYAG